MLCTNLCDDVMAELKTWYGNADSCSQKDEFHKNNSKTYF